MFCKIFKSKNGVINYEKIGNQVFYMEDAINDFLYKNNVKIENILQSQSSSGEGEYTDDYLTISIFYSHKAKKKNEE
jgi:hypothetical protein